MAENKKDFSWPVNGMDYENYEAFCTWFTQYEPIINERQLIIWGAGSRGTGFATLMRKMGFDKFLFVDSSPRIWGGCICGTDIIEPDKLEQYRERVILVSPENSGEIEKYLNSHNYKKDEDYFLIQTRTYEAYIEEFLRPYGKKTLILGSCEFSAISLDDKDFRSMREMLFEKLGKDTTKILAIHGIGLRAQYHILHAQIMSGMVPERLLLQISIDTLVAKDHLFPHTQHAKLLKMIVDTQNKPSNEFLEYVSIAEERSRNPFMNPFEGFGTGMVKAKIRNYYTYYYMADLEENAEGLAYLKKILDEASANDIEVIPFVLPVNYQLAKELLADEFDTKYKHTLDIVQEVTDANGLLNLSYALDSELFAWPEAPNASLNDQGREKIAEMLCSQIEGMV